MEFERVRGGPIKIEGPSTPQTNRKDRPEPQKSKKLTKTDGKLVFLETCLNNEREARFPCLYMYNICDMPEATYISLSLRAASVWLRHLASGLRPSLLK